MSTSKTFKFVRKIISILSVCTDEIIDVTSNYQTNNSSPGEIVNDQALAAAFVPNEPTVVSAVPPIDLTTIHEQQLTSRTVYTKPIDLSRI